MVRLLILFGLIIASFGAVANDRQYCDNIRTIVLETGTDLYNGESKDAVLSGYLDNYMYNIVHSMAVDKMMWSDGLVMFADAMERNCNKGF